MNKEVSIGIIIATLVVLLGVFGYFSFTNQVKPDNTDTVSLDGNFGINEESGNLGMGEESVIQDSPIIHTVTITSSGFSPKDLEINKGDIVLFINEGSASSWPASAVHPTHTVYPNSGISKCGSYEAAQIFDACGGLGNGESYSFTFNEVGTWGYHDHLIPSKNGKIIVS